MANAGLDGYLIAGLEHGMAGTPGLADALSRVDLIVTNTAGLGAFAGLLPAGAFVIETRGAQGVVMHDPTGRAGADPGGGGGGGRRHRRG